MENNIFEEMERAVSVVRTSPHKQNKVAATIFGKSFDGEPYSLSKTNFWPSLIEELMGRDAYIGNSSGTVHAETACILAAPKTDGASMAVTDVFCPNCAKNMAEAGIKNVYIDHKGFDKDFAKRRKHIFKTMSLKICERAGMNVFEINRKKEEVKPLVEIPDGYVPKEDDPVVIIPLETTGHLGFKNTVLNALDEHWRRKFSVAFVKMPDDNIQGVYLRSHPVLGFTMEEDGDYVMEKVDDKYSYLQEPLNRLLMTAARMGAEIIKDCVFTSYVPTAREHVNFIGAGYNSLMVGDFTFSRDEESRDAMFDLKQNGIMQYCALVA